MSLHSNSWYYRNFPLIIFLIIGVWLSFPLIMVMIFDGPEPPKPEVMTCYCRMIGKTDQMPIDAVLIVEFDMPIEHDSDMPYLECDNITYSYEEIGYEIKHHRPDCEYETGT